MKTRYWLVALLITLGLVLIGLGFGGQTWAQPLTHTVEKGDTLWDICEKYYGDPDLWPKLWQMNPFVTNPHLLKPGDVITLLEDVPIKKGQPAVQTKPLVPQPVTASAPVKQGIDVSGMVDVDTVGFLSLDKVRPLGHVFSDETERIVLSVGDIVYVDIQRGQTVQPGDQLTVYLSSPLLYHPITRDELGYCVSVLGTLAIKERVKGNIYKAEIEKSYKTIQEGDSVLPHEPVSNCIEPLPLDQELATNVVAVKEQRELAGQFSVVYLANGLNHGIRQGNIFAMVKKRQAESDEKAMLPDVVIGHVLILNARPNTAAGVVIESKEEFTSGANLSGLGEEEAQPILSALPTCALK